MPTYDHPNLTVHGRLVPDNLTDEEKKSANPPQEGAAAYEIGVEIEGVFVPIFRRRSSAGLLADIERVKASQPAGFPSASPPSNSV